MRREVVDEIITRLEGSCKTLYEVMTGVFADFGITEDTELTQEELEEIDNNIFCCDDCGWWYGGLANDGGGNAVCDHCIEAYEEDEEYDEE